jgi:LL-diaminopimelate aminotransferase
VSYWPRSTAPRHLGKTGLFIWAAVPPQYTDGYALSDAVLAEARVFLTPGGIFGSNGNGYVRASLCQPESVLREALERIKSSVMARSAQPSHQHDDVQPVSFQ